MTIQSDRRLYQQTELPTVLQLTLEQIDWLINTHQLNPIRIAGETRYDSRDLDALINTYKTTASRRIQ